MVAVAVALAVGVAVAVTVARALAVVVVVAGVGTNYLELIALRSQLIGIATEVNTWNCNSSELQPKELQFLRIAT